jgi:hypothetical protein
MTFPGIASGPGVQLDHDYRATLVFEVQLAAAAHPRVSLDQICQGVRESGLRVERTVAQPDHLISGPTADLAESWIGEPEPRVS